MCDYSLMQYPNRIAKRGEELVTYRFPSGCIGLASPADFDNHPMGSIWRRLECSLRGTDSCSVPAVCVPPSARLLVRELGSRLQREYGLGAEEVATFEQLTLESTWRDAIRFEKGCILRLQELSAGLRVRVLNLGFDSSDSPMDTSPESDCFVLTTNPSAKSRTFAP